MSARTQTAHLLDLYRRELDAGRCSSEMLTEVIELAESTVLARTDDAGCEARNAVACAVLRALVENGHAGDVAMFLDQARIGREAATARYEASKAERQAHAHGGAA